jgi:hypothetical protein
MLKKDLKEKKCKNCGEMKSTEDFYPQKAYNNSVVYDTWDCYCKSCRLKTSSERRRNLKKIAIEYLGGKCVDCGESRDIPAIYDFHHLDPNKKDFSIGKQAKKFDSVKSELDKCVLVCANCHRIRHSQDHKEVGLEAATD